MSVTKSYRILVLLLTTFLLLSWQDAFAMEQPEGTLSIPLREDTVRVLLPADSVQVPLLADMNCSITMVSDSATAVYADSMQIAVGDTLDLNRFADWKPDPIRAMWLGMVFPGGGQIYNRKYWKLPIVYGGVLGCIYAVSWNCLLYTSPSPRDCS